MVSTTYQLPESLEADLEEFRRKTEQFRRDELSFAEYRAFRVPQGVYEQREEGTHMLRVRLPAGVVLPHQLKILARVSQRYGDGVLHVTDRQDIQVHRVPLEQLHPALVELYAAGLSTKGGGGNTVRNITACPLTGVCPSEAFDVAPDAVALTERLVNEPLSYRLPRKLKIGFAGCADDCAGVQIHDLGFMAKRQNNRQGYAVYVGGGMGAHSRVGQLLEPFVPADRIHHVAVAVMRVFDLHGNRRNRQKARLRFLIEQMGMERFRTLYEDQRRRLEAEGNEFALHPMTRTRSCHGQEAEAVPVEGFDEWRQRNVLGQKQTGYHVVQIPLRCGNIDAGTMDALAGIVADHGEAMARATQSQNLVLRCIHENGLPTVHRELAALELAEPAAPILQQIVSCPGAATCKLGLCLSRGLAQAITAELTYDSLDLDALGKLNVHISGCPNACGRHPIGNIGLYGAARRVHGRLVPHYVLQLGGRTGEGCTRLAEGRHTIPAKRVPVVVAELLRAFQNSPQFPDFHAFVDGPGHRVAKALAAQHREVPSFEMDPSYYHDWSSEQPFSLAGRGPGECGAGVFDLIELDLASAHEALEQERPHAATIAAARALLVTRGLEARSDVEALKLFTDHFIDAGLVADTFRELIELARTAATHMTPERRFAVSLDWVGPLVHTVQQLYDSLDASLRFEPAQPSRGEEAEAASEPSTPPESVEPDQEIDLRGVACPLNYVRTKMALDQQTSGEILAVLLNDEGASSVPDSVEKDGHEVLDIQHEREGWRVLIRRA